MASTAEDWAVIMTHMNDTQRLVPDRVGFDPDYRSEPLEHFEPLVREILTPKG